MNGMPAARSDIATLDTYKAGDQVDDTIRLNANEAPLAHGPSTLNRYPEVRPAALQSRMAELLDVSPEQLLVTRGSSEAIDVLIRCWCKAYTDTVLTTPPTFEMYRVYADIQGVALIEVPLDLTKDFALDTEQLIESCLPSTKLVFLCSPNNPTGTVIPEEEICRVATALDGQAVVVVDEAYVEFSDQDSLVSGIDRFENLVVLRTLSKAHALAGARCGAAIACPSIINVMGKVLPPYSFSTPVIETVMSTLSDGLVEEAGRDITAIRAERERVSRKLAEDPSVDRVWPSQANFVLARFHSLQPVQDFLFEKRILIRDFSDTRGLDNCARITIGARNENDTLLEALAEYREDA